MQAQTTDQVIESLAGRDRIVMLASLALLLTLAWAYTAVMALGHGGMAMAAWEPWTVTEAAFMLVMWIVMMAAMMIPSAAPMLLTFARISRSRAQVPVSIGSSGAFLLGYLALWAAFSLFATTAQWLLHAAALLSPAMASASLIFSGAVLIAAGIYQFTPIKDACLAKCRMPLGFLLSEWRNGSRGAFVMGLRHGLYCVGCCWLVMALLFVAGIMNLLWIAFLALIVLGEKVLPHGQWVARALGMAAIAWGGWLLAIA